MQIIIDIETVREFPTLKEAPDAFRVAWTDFSMKKWPEDNSHETFLQHAGIYPEFGKIICISVKRDEKPVASFYGADESDLLGRFKKAFQAVMAAGKGRPSIIGHRIKTFDIPWINTRMAINGMELMDIFKTYGSKPWELLQFIDTWEVWKGGNFNSVNSASLASICMALSIESPKDDIDGSMVGDVFWNDNDIERIVTYCEKDVDKTAEAFRAMQQLNMT